MYSTQELLDAEQRLLDAARSTGGPAVHPALAREMTARLLPGREHPLSTEQQAAVTAVVTSGRVLDVLVGPAGTGKSTAMAGVRAAWEATYGPGSVVGLAPSAAAADVLADAVGVPTENTAKWLAEQANQPQRRARLDDHSALLNRASPTLATRRLRDQAARLLAEYRRWALTPGRLVIVDEASMAATRDLDQITQYAAAAGAKMLLVGDWAQLSPVNAGGAFKLLATDRDDTPTLHDVCRFRHEWERDASLAIRAGAQSAADTYIRHGRVESGSREDMLDLLFDGWRTDTTAGRHTLMLAADAQTVADLNARARTHRISTGQVSTGLEVTLADRTRAGVGDLVVTRHNHRALAVSPSPNGWVKNGDEWTVEAICDDGSLSVRRRAGRAVALLPPRYVAEHIELGYATTAHRAQGRTVDTAHAYLSAATLREPLYVMATRGRETNRLYIDTEYDPDLATAHEQPDTVPMRELLRMVIANTGADTSAHEARQAEEEAAVSPALLQAQGAVTAARRTAKRLATAANTNWPAPGQTRHEHEL